MATNGAKSSGRKRPPRELCIKRHVLAVDTLGFPFFTHCTSANLSDDAGLLEMLTHFVRLFPVETCEYSQDYHLVRSRLSSRPFDPRATAGVSAEQAENQV